MVDIKQITLNVCSASGRDAGPITLPCLSGDKLGFLNVLH